MKNIPNIGFKRRDILSSPFSQASQITVYIKGGSLGQTESLEKFLRDGFWFHKILSIDYKDHCRRQSASGLTDNPDRSFLPSCQLVPVVSMAAGEGLLLQYRSFKLVGSLANFPPPTKYSLKKKKMRVTVSITKVFLFSFPLFFPFFSLLPLFLPLLPLFLPFVCSLIFPLPLSRSSSPSTYSKEPSTFSGRNETTKCNIIISS